MAIARRPPSLRVYRRRIERKLRPRVALLIHLATVASFALDGPDPESAIDDVRALRDRCDEALAAVHASGT